MDKLTSILAIVEDSAGGSEVFDKAVRLARFFAGRVDLLVTDPRLAGEFFSRRAALACDKVEVECLDNTAEPLHRLLSKRLRAQSPDLLVKARASGHPLRRWTLDRNDYWLARENPAPLLLVGALPWSEPLRLAAAVDVSDWEKANVARGVLQAAGFLALGSHGSLDVLYSEREKDDETIRMERAVRLARLVREFHVGCERLRMFEGAPDDCLPPQFSAGHYDVLVLGADSHRGESVLTTASLSARLVEASKCDVLLVPAARPALTVPRGQTPSRLEQAAHQG